MARHRQPLGILGTVSVRIHIQMNSLQSIIGSIDRGSRILKGIGFVDLHRVLGEDPLAFATGYITAKLGLHPDPVMRHFPIPDYDAGYKLGLNVRLGKESSPSWDKGPLPRPN